MNESLNKPKGFSEILDETFRLCKNHFSNLYMPFLMLLGPIYLIQTVILLVTGTSFFRVAGKGNTWYEQIITSMNGDTDPAAIASQGIMTLVLGLASIVLAPIAYASILFIIDHLKSNQEFTVKAMVKQAFSRFWPIFGSSLLFGIISFGMFFVMIFLVAMIGVILGEAVHVALGVVVGILLFLGSALVIVLLITRMSLFLGGTALEKDAPGFARSWRLTHKQTWKTLGVFLVLYLIAGVISSAIQGILIISLGNSVFYTIIVDLVGMFTSMIIAVAYAVIYFDLKTRHDADDLKEMLEGYDGEGN